MSKLEMAIIRLAHGEGLKELSYGSTHAAGIDLRAACTHDVPIVLQPGERCLVPTGMIFEIPDSHEGQIRPRSGLAYKYGITCLNTPGTIDCDYRGEVKVLLINHGEAPFTIERGMRIAQMVIAQFTQVKIVEKKQSSETARGGGGFGSTGTD